MSTGANQTHLEMRSTPNARAPMIRDASQTVDEEEPDYYDPNSDLTQAPDTSESGTTGNIS